MTERASLYCRLSKEDEDADAAQGRESESIQNQRALLMQYAAEHGYAVAGVYCDEDYSGMDRTRPAFNRLLEDARMGKFEIVLAKTQSRFTRDMELVERYLHGKFPEWGVRFIATVDHVDTADPAGKKSRQINGLVNEWYLEDLSASVRAVLDSKRRRGQYIAAFALYGYQKDPQDGHRLVVDPEAAAVVRHIFALCLAGEGAGRIARQLNAEGVPPPSRYRWERMGGAPGAELWSRATVSQMLRCRTYAGDLVQGRHRRVSYKSARMVWLPQEQWIVVPETQEPIVPRETFEAVQAQLARRARGGRSGTRHPLARKVVCGLCGSRMEQTGSGARRYYRCRMAQRAPDRCPGQPYLRADAAEQLVWERLQALFCRYLDPQKALPAPSLSEQTALQTRRSALRREADRRRKALEALYLDKCSGLLEEKEFRSLQEAYRGQLADYEQRLARLEQPAPQPPAPSAPQRLTGSLVDAFVERLEVFPPETVSSPRRLVLVWKV